MKYGHFNAYGEKTGVFIIDSIPHCPSGKRICQNLSVLILVINGKLLNFLNEVIGIISLDCPSGKRICQNMQNQRIRLHCYKKAKLE